MKINKNISEDEIKVIKEATRRARQKYNELIQKDHKPEGTLSVLGRDPTLNNSPDASGESMSTHFTREGDLSATSRSIELEADDVNAVNDDDHIPLQGTIYENLGEAVEILGESNANIRSPKDYWPATASSSESSIFSEDSDNQRLAASPLTPRDGEREEVVLPEANQSPNIKLGGKFTPFYNTPVPKLSLGSINPNDRLEESNKTYANFSQPSLLFRALETSRQLHNLPENFLPLGKSQSSAIEPEKKFSTKNCLKDVSNSIEKSYREQYRGVNSPLREKLEIEKLPIHRHFSNESSTAPLTNFDSTVTGDDHSTLPFLSSTDFSNGLEDNQGDDTQPDSPSQSPVNHLELHQVSTAHNLAARVASSTNAAEIGCEILSPIEKPQRGYCLPFLFCR